MSSPLRSGPCYGQGGPMASRYFSRSLGYEGAPLHLAAHSHHPWPDVSFEAQARAWEDAARLLDRKWDYIFSVVRPKAQTHVARHLSLSDPSTVTFSGNTHDFLCRILSCLDWSRPPRILTTDSEFHSFTRQTRRLAEEGLVFIERVPVEPFETFAERFAERAKEPVDLIYLSHVFYNSGFVLSMATLEDIIACVPDDDTMVVVDGYHSFMAVPVNFSHLEARAFYLSGGYKYAMAGEGVCFAHVPPGYGPRPRITGWYAAFSALNAPGDGSVPYGEDASRFDGATFDPVGLYRFNAVMDWLETEGLTVSVMAAYVRTLQNRVLDGLRSPYGGFRGALAGARLVLDPAGGQCGRFLTFDFADSLMDAAEVHGGLMGRNVITDYRDTRLRLGLGIYHDMQDLACLAAHMEALS